MLVVRLLQSSLPKVQSFVKIHHMIISMKHLLGAGSRHPQTLNVAPVKLHLLEQYLIVLHIDTSIAHRCFEASIAAAEWAPAQSFRSTPAETSKVFGNSRPTNKHNSRICETGVFRHVDDSR